MSSPMIRVVYAFLGKCGFELWREDAEDHVFRVTRPEREEERP